MPTCKCDFLFNDGERCQGVQNIVLMTLLFVVLMSACFVALYCRKVKKRLRRQSRQASYYEDVIQDKNSELVQLQVFSTLACFGPFLTQFSVNVDPRAPCAVLYLALMLIGC